MHYTSFIGDSFKTQIELLSKLSDESILSFDPGMLYVEKGFDELKAILERTNILLISSRSEERRVGKECRSRWSPYH